MDRWTRFEHACPACEYTGSGSVNGEQVDFYRCGDTAVARYGDGRHEYWSMPVANLQSAADHGSTYASAALHSLSGAQT